MKDLSLQTGAHTVHWGENTSCIFIVEAKRVTPIVTHIDIPVYFIQDQFDNGLFFQNTRSTVSFRKICVTNHVQFQ